MLFVLPYTPEWRQDPALCAMFSARKRVFIDLLKWEIPVCDHAYEIDQFDAPGAVYLILMNRDGSHRASARLLPTDRPHLLGTLFPDLCAGKAPMGEAVLEITRFCLERDMRAADRRHARNELVSALADYGFVHRLTTFTGVADQGWFEQIQTFGWDCRALGNPMVRNGRALTGLRIDLSDDTRDRLIATGIYRRAGQIMEKRHAA